LRELKELKASSLLNFQAQTLGDIKNTKNQSYMKKLKIEFHLARDQTLKKNNEVITKSSKTILDKLLQMVKS